MVDGSDDPGRIPGTGGTDAGRVGSARRKGPAALWYAGYLIVAVAGCLVLLEGIASFVVSVRSSAADIDVAERRYCEYDPDLGWVSRPGVRIEDMFGSGRRLVTNSRRFRSAREFSPSVEPGRTRVVCSGDSFTFGFGVANEDAWCELLGALDPRLEPVNMGQGGYGLDQAWLWYRRDAAALEHQIQILAFTGDDFDRMLYTTLFGYGKPVLALDGGRLAARNVPVPTALPFYRSRWATAATITLRKLRLYTVLRGWFGSRAHPVNVAAPPDALPEIVAALVADLGRTHRERGSLLVLAYLPVREEYGADSTNYRNWRNFLVEAAARDGAVFLDLLAEMRALPREEVPRLFIGATDLTYLNAEGHYSEEGNRFIARTIYRLLGEDPRVKALVSRR